METTRNSDYRQADDLFMHNLAFGFEWSKRKTVDKLPININSPNVQLVFHERQLNFLCIIIVSAFTKSVGAEIIPVLK